MTRKKYLPVYGTSALAIFSGMTATAQEKPAAGADAEVMNEVVVTGMRQSMRDSVIMKQSSDLITDNISTADIGQLPDVTIAEELNRLPGVNTTRDRGNASQAAVRGLGPTPGIRYGERPRSRLIRTVAGCPLGNLSIGGPLRWHRCTSPRTPH